MKTSRLPVKFLAVGQIRNEFIVDLEGRATSNILGGSLLYAAGAMRSWTDHVGMIGAVNSTRLKDTQILAGKMGCDHRGIRGIEHFLDIHDFYAYPSSDRCIRDNPVPIYSARNIPIPRELLDYKFDPVEGGNGEKNEILRPLLVNIPAEYLDASSAHICPLDLKSHIQLNSIFLKGSIRTITIQPHSSYMKSTNWDTLHAVIKDITGFLVHENDIRNLFIARSEDIWEMAETITGFGCKFVVIRNEQKGYYLFDSITNKRFRIPDFPAREVDPTGCFDAFCGGFLVGLQTTYDPVRAAVLGSVSTSFKIEKCGPLKVNSSLPGLAEARAEVIQSMIISL